MFVMKVEMLMQLAEINCVMFPLFQNRYSKRSHLHAESAANSLYMEFLLIIRKDKLHSD